MRSGFVVSCLMVILAAPSFGQDALLSRYLPSGSDPLRIVVADVDADSLPDLITSHSDGLIGVQLGQPGGVFAAPLNLIGQVWERALVLADLDADGALDLLTSGTTSSQAREGQLAVRLGLGDGTFGAAALFNVRKAPKDLAVEDLDDDGWLDVVVIGNDPRASVLYGLGDGSFEPEVDVSTGGAGPSAMALADLDGDGRSDLVFGGGAGALVSVLLNAGGRSFSSPITSPFAASPRDFAFGHFDDDGVLDIAVGFKPGDLLYALGNGDGSFAGAIPIDMPSSPERVVTADLDEDGDVDLVVPASSGPELTVLLGDGLGGFGPPRVFGIGTAARDLAVADLNGDGDLDVAVIDDGLERTLVLHGHGDGGFDGDGLGAAPFELAFHDLDDDGVPDRLHSTSATIELAFGQGDGRFGAAGPIAGAGANTFLLGDFDDDGVQDLVSRGTQFSPTLRLQLGLGGGLFGVASSVAYNSGLKALASADVNNDGALDLVVLENHGGTVRMRLGDNLGGLALGWGQSAGPQADQLAAADLDADGKVDYVTSNILGAPQLARGNGNGSFQPPTSLLGVTASSSIALADLDGDGDADLVSADYHTSTLSTQLNDGSANFAAPFSMSTTLDFSVLTVLLTPDVDDDGWQDVAFAFNDTSSGVLATNLGIHRSLGDGSLDTWWTGQVAGRLRAAADVDGDGAVDLHVLGNQQVELLRSQLGPWKVLGSPLSGAAGLPKLRGSGPVTPGSDYSLVLDDAAANTLTSLFLGLTVINVPFKGGTLVPALDVFLSPIFTDAEGRYELSGVWPVDFPQGFSLYMQAWIQDGQGVAGLAASNALELRVP